MELLLITAPTIEPVSLQDFKEHARLNSGSFSDNYTATQSIAPGSHAVVADYTLLGTSVIVGGFSSSVVFDAGTNGSGGTVDVKIQDSDDNTTWVDWTGGAFTQVTTSNDNQVFKKEYTGSKKYIRPVAKTLAAACEFGVQIAKYSSDVTEDSLITSFITAAREHVETILHSKLINQTWELYLDAFPSGAIKIPFSGAGSGKLQSVTSIKYIDSDNVETTMTVTTAYLVDTLRSSIILPTDVSWPAFTPYPLNPIVIRFVCGYGSAASDIPNGIRIAIKMYAASLYELRESEMQGAAITENLTCERLLKPYRNWDF